MLKGQNKVYTWRVHDALSYLNLMTIGGQHIKAEWYSLCPLMLVVIVMGIISDTELKSLYLYLIVILLSALNAIRSQCTDGSRVRRKSLR